MNPQETQEVFRTLGGLTSNVENLGARLEQLSKDLTSFITESRKLWHDEMNQLQRQMGAQDFKIMKLEQFRDETLNTRKIAARWMTVIGLAIGSGIVEAIHLWKGH